MRISKGACPVVRVTLDNVNQYIQIEYPISSITNSISFIISSMFNIKHSRFPALTSFALDPRPNLVVRSLTASVENPPGFTSLLKIGAQDYHITSRLQDTSLALCIGRQHGYHVRRHPSLLMTFSAHSYLTQYMDFLHRIHYRNTLTD